MPKGLKRYYGRKHLHFITCSCYRRRPGLGSRVRRDLFLRVLEQVRQRYRFSVVGYVVMPEHFHLLISEPEQADPSLVMQVLKQIVSRQLRRPGTRRFWQARYCRPVSTAALHPTTELKPNRRGRC